MTDRELKEIRKKISCPQLGDTHYGEWGILTQNQRFTIKRMLDLIESQEQYIRTLTANGVIVPPCKVGDRYVMDTAKTIFNAWNDVTGALIEGTSWYYELESVIEDIVKLSFGAGVLYKEEAEEKLKECNNGTT